MGAADIMREDVRRNTGMPRRPHAQRFPGFTLIEITIVVAIIGLLAGLAVPSFIKARTTAQTKACVSNLRVLDTAKSKWALENRKASSAVPTVENLGPYVRGGVMPICPAGGTYKLLAVDQDPTCSLDRLGHVLQE